MSKSYLTTALDKGRERVYNKNSTVRNLGLSSSKALPSSKFGVVNAPSYIGAFKDDVQAASELDYLYDDKNIAKTRSFLENNGFPSREEREYDREYYGEQTERSQALSEFKSKVDEILNPKLPDATERSFLSGFLGDEEEKRKYNEQVAAANRARDEFENAFRGSPFEREITVAPKLPMIRNASDLTPEHAINRNPNRELTPENAINRNVNEPLTVTQYSSKNEPVMRLFGTNKVNPLNKLLTREFNNHVFTSKNDSYTEKGNGFEGFLNTDYYYAEKDGKRYRANSEETVTLDDWNSIDENFLDGTFEKLINEANQQPTDILRILSQSIGGDLDFKRQLDESKLYLANGVLYNKNEAGNFVWAYFLESKKVSGYLSGALAQFGTFLPSISKMNGTARWDEDWDVKARWAGVKYYYEKNDLMWLYNILYGDMPKY